MTEEKHFYQNINASAAPLRPNPSNIKDLPIEETPSVPSRDIIGGKGKLETVPAETVRVGKRWQLPENSVSLDGDNTLLWLSRYPVERNHPRPLTGAIPEKRSGEVLVFELNDKLTEAFQRLIVEGFNSSPVVNQQGQYVGIVDLLDLTWCAMRSYQQYRFNQNMSDTSKHNEYLQKWLTTEEFGNLTIRDVLNAPAWRNRELFFPVYPGFSTLYATEFMARTAIHRMPILNKDKKVINILTQSMMISLLDQNLYRFNSIRNTTVSNIISGLVPDLETIGENDLAIDAFKKMVSKEITGLPIVNSFGVLVDTISVRDLRGIGMNADRYERLWLPIKLFKERVRQEFNIQTPPAPIYVTTSNTFGDLIRKTDDGNIHRIFVCYLNSASEPIPTHVITHRDILRYVLFRMGLDPKTIQEE